MNEGLGEWKKLGEILGNCMYNIKFGCLGYFVWKEGVECNL
jgi:hypothetical protein